MPQSLAVISRTFLAASLVAATVFIPAVGVLGWDGSGRECTATRQDADISSLGSPMPAATDIPGAGSTALDAPVTLTLDGCGSAGPSATTSPSPDPGASAPASPAVAVTIEVETRDPYFSPTELRLPAKGGARMVLTNSGYVTHNLTVDELGIQLVASRGGTDELTLRDLPAGTFAFYCSVSGHREAGMEGTLKVE